MQRLALLLVAFVATGANLAYSRPVALHPASTPNDSEFQDSLDFLLQNMPPTDLTLGREYLRTNVELALAARHQHPWSAAVPFDLFLDYVLPYASVDEPREDWRGMFHTLFRPMVANATSITEAALLLNKDIWKIWGIHFKSDQTPEIMSPSQVIKAGFASCTGLSIFLVNAYRSVGIPARVAGTPSWNNHPTSPERFNNHNWVEVWDSGIWSFTGPTEWTPLGFNHTWFVPDPARLALPGDLMHAIYAATFRPASANTNTYFPLAWNPSYQGVPAVDVTDYYLNVSAAAVATTAAATSAAGAAGSADSTAGAEAAVERAAERPHAGQGAGSGPHRLAGSLSDPVGLHAVVAT